MHELSLFIEGLAAILRQEGVPPNPAFIAVEAYLVENFRKFYFNQIDLKMRIQETYDRIGRSK